MNDRIGKREERKTGRSLFQIDLKWNKFSSISNERMLPHTNSFYSHINRETHLEFTYWIFFTYLIFYWIFWATCSLWEVGGGLFKFTKSCFTDSSPERVSKELESEFEARPTLLGNYSELNWWSANHEWNWVQHYKNRCQTCFFVCWYSFCQDCVQQHKNGSLIAAILWKCLLSLHRKH